MRYIVYPVRGIVFEIDDEPEPIPLDVAVKTIEAIADKQRNALERVEAKPVIDEGEK